MTLDYHTLKTVNPQALLDFGFDAAEPYLANAYDYFDSEVGSAVQGGAAWTGEGQPQAAYVMEINSVALETSRLQMQAGGRAMYSLYTAISKAKEDLEESETDAERVGRSVAESSTKVAFQGVQISADGAVTILVSPNDGELNAADDVADQLFWAENQLTSKVRTVLNYAQTADLTAKALLDRILNSRPVFSANASAEALAYNLATRELARATVTLADETMEFWSDESPESWKEIPAEWSSSDALGELWDSLLPNPVSLAKGDFSELADLGSYFLPHSKVLKIADKVLTLKDVIGAGIHTEYTDLYAPVNPHLGRFHPDDVVLDYLAGRYYLHPDDPMYQAGLTDIGEAARFQATHGGSSIGGVDYVERAREVRDELAQWLRDTYVDDPNEADIPNLGDSDRPLPVSPEDEADARALLNRLDNALAGS
ncbi:MAG: hypothetical protein GEV10_20090 [Streptosporangiales bacterium]|nr:hypothetical protein [Streptosporangiales bacterium]